MMELYDLLEEYRIEDMDGDDAKEFVLSSLKMAEFKKFREEVYGKAREWLESGNVRLMQTGIRREDYWLFYPYESDKNISFYRAYHHEYPHLTHEAIFTTIQRALFEAKRKMDMEAKEKEGKIDRTIEWIQLLLMGFLIGGVISLMIIGIVENCR